MRLCSDMNKKCKKETKKNDYVNHSFGFVDFIPLNNNNNLLLFTCFGMVTYNISSLRIEYVVSITNCMYID